MDFQMAINKWLATLFRFRLSGLEDIRAHNIANHPLHINAPPHLYKVPKLKGQPNNDPVLQGMNRIVDVLILVLDKGDEELLADAYSHLESHNPKKCVHTEPWLLEQAMQTTIFKWQEMPEIKSGHKNRTNKLRQLASSFWIAAHIPYALIGLCDSDDDGDGEDRRNIYEGWDTVYLANPKVQMILDE
ncbi:hypothetical protein C0989_001868, partial [Termitomyces sp. Mn162]